MRDTTTYGKLPRADLLDELISISAQLSFLHRELGALSSNQHRDYLLAWARSPGNSVAAKNREAEYEVKELTQEIIDFRAQINSLSEIKNLLLYMLLSRFPEPLTHYPPAAQSEDSMMVVPLA